MHARSILPGGCTHYGWTKRIARPGQLVVCQIVAVATDHYDIFIPQYERRGHLYSKEKHAVGDSLLVVYICMDKGKALTAERSSK